MGVGVTEREFMAFAQVAHEMGIKLEIAEGLPIWKPLPPPVHTLAIRRVERSVRPEGTFHSFKDMAIRFPDGSIRRPDIAVFCRLPAETRESTTLVPEAVVELTSPRSENKDLLLSPGFYLGQGVKDVMVYVPGTGVVEHFRRDGRALYRSPVDLRLECGCLITF